MGNGVEKTGKIWYKVVNNRVVALVNTGANSFLCHKGCHQYVKSNNDPETSSEYPLVVSGRYIEIFLSANKLDENNLAVDGRSIDHFYGYNDVLVGKMTPKFIERWMDYDQPKLYRYSVNKDGRRNWIGISLLCFSNVLVDWSYMGVNIDEDITDEDAQLLMEGSKGTLLAEAIELRLAARKIPEEQISKMRKHVDGVNERVQKVIDEAADEIMAAVKKQYPDRIHPLSGSETFKSALKAGFRIDDNFGLDCGWLSYRTTDEEFERCVKTLNNIPGDYANLDIKLPYATQSVTLQRVMFEAAKPIIREKCGFTVYANAHLD